MTGASPSKDRRLKSLLVVAAGIAIAAAVPLLLIAGRPSSPRAPETGATPPTAAQQPPPERAAPPTGDASHDWLARARRRMEGANSELHQKFDCKPVARDETDVGDQYPVPRPPFTEDIYPCTRCHDRPNDFNPNRRPLTLQHTDIKLIHGPREQWCYDCHNPTMRDKLRLAGGRLVSFEKSYELCGQCHGPKLRDWRLGIHGRRVGCWNGKRQYLLCVHCHSPHAPAFPPIKPLPPPDKPSEIKRGQHER